MSRLSKREKRELKRVLSSEANQRMAFWSHVVLVLLGLQLSYLSYGVFSLYAKPNSLAEFSAIDYARGMVVAILVFGSIYAYLRLRNLLWKVSQIMREEKPDWIGLEEDSK